MQLPKGPAQQAANLSSAYGGRRKKSRGIAPPCVAMSLGPAGVKPTEAKSLPSGLPRRRQN